MLNLFLAVLFESYSLANSLEENGITNVDLEMFFLTWQKFDPFATQFIHTNQLNDFLSELEKPLRLPQPNDYAISFLNMPLTKGNLIHCVDLIHAVAKYTIRDVEEDNEFKEMQEILDQQFLQRFQLRSNYRPFTSTRQMIKKNIIRNNIN